MELGDLPQHEIMPNMGKEKKELAEQAPLLMLKVIEDGGLENITAVSDIPKGSVSAMGGAISVGYFLENNKRPTFVKFARQGPRGEAGVFNAWRKQGAAVPTVYKSGIISDREGKDLEYAVMEGIVDETGKPASTGDDFLKTHPDKAEEVGKAMGEELVKMHAAKSERPFGWFGSDSRKNEGKTYVEVIKENLREHASVFRTIGLPDSESTKLIEQFNHITFPEKGVYIHNDNGPHNVLVPGKEPVRICYIDPELMIGDPYLDLAKELNRMAWFKRMHEKYPDNGEYARIYAMEDALGRAMIDAYQVKASIDAFDQKRMVANQIVQAADSLNWELDNGDMQSDLNIARTDVLKENIQQLLVLH